MDTNKHLSSLGIGESCNILSIDTPGALRSRLMELGFISGAEVRCLHKNSGMTAYLISGSVIALRHTDAQCITTS